MPRPACVVMCSDIQFLDGRHVHAICRPTGCYALILTFPFLLWLVCCCLVVFYPRRLKFVVVNVRVRSEVIYYRKTSVLNIFLHTVLYENFLKEKIPGTNAFVLVPKVFVTSTINMFVFYLESGSETPHEKIRNQEGKFV